jgi:hypothetical protein
VPVAQRLTALKPMRVPVPYRVRALNAWPDSVNAPLAQLTLNFNTTCFHHYESDRSRASRCMIDRRCREGTKRCKPRVQLRESTDESTANNKSGNLYYIRECLQSSACHPHRRSSARSVMSILDESLKLQELFQLRQLPRRGAAATSHSQVDINRQIECYDHYDTLL